MCKQIMQVGLRYFSKWFCHSILIFRNEPCVANLTLLAILFPKIFILFIKTIPHDVRRILQLLVKSTHTFIASNPLEWTQTSHMCQIL